MESEGGTGSRRTQWVFKEIREGHPVYSIQPKAGNFGYLLFFALWSLNRGLRRIAKAGKAPDTLKRAPEMMDTPPILQSDKHRAPIRVP